MAAVTLVQAQEMLDLYLGAEKKILTNQSYSIGSRTFTRADLRYVGDLRKYWEKTVESITNGGAIRVRRVLPRSL